MPRMLALILAAAFALPPLKSDAHIGVSAVDLRTGRRVSVNGNEHFPMGSVYKFPIALSVLRHVRLDEPVTIEPKDFSPGWSPLRDAAKGKAIHMTAGELLQSMLRDSDNTAGDYYIRRLGAETLTKEIGVAGIRVDRTEKAIAADIKAGGQARYHADPRDTSTPDAMVALLASFAKNPPPLAWKHMLETTTGARRIKSVLPKGATLAHKTGTMPGVVNDVGIITLADGRQIAIAIFTKRADNEKDARVEDDIAAVARKVLAELLKEGTA